MYNDCGSKDEMKRKDINMKESKGTLAAKKAWKTMRASESKMTPKQLKALHLKRSKAAKKAWNTMRGIAIPDKTEVEGIQIKGDIRKINCPQCGQLVLNDSAYTPCVHVLAWYSHAMGDWQDVPPSVKRMVEEIAKKKDISDPEALVVLFHNDKSVQVIAYKGPYLGGCVDDNNLVVYRKEKSIMRKPTVSPKVSKDALLDLAEKNGFKFGRGFKCTINMENLERLCKLIGKR